MAVTQSAENDVLLVDTLERLVYLLERGDYVPFGLITEARNLVDGARVPPPATEDGEVACLVCGLPADESTCDGTRSAHCVVPPARGNE